MGLFDHLLNRKGLIKGSHDPSKADAYRNMDEKDQVDDRDTDKKKDQMLSSDTDNEGEEETYEVVEREIHPTKIICPDCGGITLEGLDYCDKCGGELH
ncbi:MAG TPA: hypothetical protein VN131_01130 [Mobilitalea sp.]|nr:hypothetical protein [Mobilitalea sp.]